MPAVPKGLFDNMDANIEKLKEQIRGKLSDIDPEIKDAVDEHFLEMIDSKKEQECSCTSCTCEKKPVTERIKTFEDACDEIGRGHKLVEDYGRCSYLGVSKDIVAYLKLRIICAALNEGWEPQFTKNEYRYYTYFMLYSEKDVERMGDKTKNKLGLVLWGGIAVHGAYCGLACASSSNAWSSSAAGFGSRLCLRTRELAEYCGRQFIDLWKDLYVGK